MNDIVKRLKSVNDQSLIMQVVRDCMEAAEEIEELRAECARKTKALSAIKKAVKDEGLAAKERDERLHPSAQHKKSAKKKA